MLSALVVVDNNIVNNIIVNNIGNILVNNIVDILVTKRNSKFETRTWCGSDILSLVFRGFCDR